MTQASVILPPKLVPIFAPPRGSVRYRGSYGGRGSGKSFSFAKMAAVWGYAEPLRILCTREFQVSIKESFHAELKAAIASEPWLAAHYDVGVDYIRGANGTEFIFRGLRRIKDSIKSLAKIDLTIMEEAEDIPEESFNLLFPTVMRQPKSEIWVIWNPKDENSPVDTRFRRYPPDGCLIAEMNYGDNPFFPDGLEDLRQHQLKTLDPATYSHIWDGQYLKNSELRVFHNWRVEEFEAPADAVLRFGADWGFAKDPTVLIRCYTVGRKMYIDYEAYQVGCEIMDTPSLFMTVPEAEAWPIVADSARPETISHMRKNGFPKMMAAVKGANSIKEGVEWLKTFEIIVHPRCVNTIKELTYYSYKKDKDTGAVLPLLEDANNNVIDAIRYANEGARRVQAQKPAPTKMLPTANRW